MTTTRHGPLSRAPGSIMESTTIQGQLLVLGDQHRIAIHSRGGELWVAEFHGDRAELLRAAAWFRLHYGICHTSLSLRRALRSAVPLSSEMAATIEKLHRLAESRMNTISRCSFAQASPAPQKAHRR